MKERLLEVPPGTMIEVRLLNKKKLRGRLGEINDEGFNLTTAQGEKITKARIAFTDLKSFKKVEGKKAGAGRIVIYMLAGIGVFVVVAIIMAATHPGG